MTGQVVRSMLLPLTPTPSIPETRKSSSNAQQERKLMEAPMIKKQQSQAEPALNSFGITTTTTPVALAAAGDNEAKNDTSQKLSNSITNTPCQTSTQFTMVPNDIKTPLSTFSSCAHNDADEEEEEEEEELDHTTTITESEMYYYNNIISSRDYMLDKHYSTVYEEVLTNLQNVDKIGESIDHIDDSCDDSFGELDSIFSKNHHLHTPGSGTGKSTRNNSVESPETMTSSSFSSVDVCSNEESLKEEEQQQKQVKKPSFAHQMVRKISRTISMYSLNASTTTPSEQDTTSMSPPATHPAKTLKQRQSFISLKKRFSIASFHDNESVSSLNSIPKRNPQRPITSATNTNTSSALVVDKQRQRQIPSSVKQLDGYSLGGSGVPPRRHPIVQIRSISNMSLPQQQRLSISSRASSSSSSSVSVSTSSSPLKNRHRIYTTPPSTPPPRPTPAPKMNLLRTIEDTICATGGQDDPDYAEFKKVYLHN